MSPLYYTEEEVARDLHAVLQKVEEGFEIVVEKDSRPVAIIKPPITKGRMISEVIADLKAHASAMHVDKDFARDVEEGRRARRPPWTQPSGE